MNLLVLGGTVFLGRHVVGQALAAGHRVTLFTRGLTQPGLFPAAEHLFGDRDGGLAPLLDRHWDAVIDTCGFAPRVVAQSTALNVGRYVFVSTVSVYPDHAVPPDERSPVFMDAEPESAANPYGAGKAACERVIQGAYGERATLVRPALIGGPWDPTRRSTYWVRRIADGGDVLAPAPPHAPVEVIDVRDLAAFLLKLAADAKGGVFNAVGPPTTLGAYLGEARRLLNPEARLRWVGPAHLAGVHPWSELPLWLPAPEYAGMMAMRADRAEAAGLVRRPWQTTLADTAAWCRENPEESARQADGRYADHTLGRAKEAEILSRLP